MSNKDKSMKGANAGYQDRFEDLERVGVGHFFAGGVHLDGGPLVGRVDVKRRSLHDVSFEASLADF